MSQEQESPKNLEDFIEKHHKLLTVIGVFGGLTALFTTIEPDALGDFFAFWSFTIFFVLNWELFSKFPKIESFNNRLVLFQLLTMFLGFCVFMYLILVYAAYSLVFGSLFALLFSSVIIAEYVKFAKRHKTTGEVLGFIILGTLVVGVIIVILFVIVLVALLLSYLGIIPPFPPA